MRKNLGVSRWALVVTLLLSPALKAQHMSASDDPGIGKLLPFTPTGIIAQDKAYNAHNGKGSVFNPDDVNIFYSDPIYLDGPAHAPYVVALYRYEVEGDLVVLRDDGTLKPIFEVDGLPGIGPGEIFAREFAGDGKPDVAVDLATSGHDTAMMIYHWTGNKLVLLPAPKPPYIDQFGTEPDPEFDNADIESVVGNGTLQIVENACQLNWDYDGTYPDGTLSHEDCSNPYKVYTYSNGAFHLAFTSKTDPSGFIGPDGTPDITIAKLTRVRPDRVTRAEIQHAIAAGSGDGDRDDDGDDVTIRIGDLSQPFSKSLAPVYADQIDLSTLFIGAGVHPTSAVVRGRDEDDWGSALGKNKHFNGPFVEAKFPRLPFLKMLASQIADGKFEMPPDRDQEHGEHHKDRDESRHDLNGPMLVRFNIDGKMKGGGGFHTIGLITVVGGAPTAADHSHGRH